ncbi:MAG: GMC family oxidoreductase [Gammaproteobacteria bacterium]|nr:GMC family oxidoreductase [Gammaproteobacteria bacterium]
MAETDLQLSGHCWDAAVIGSGIGGATVGAQLAAQGLSVAFLEKGRRIAAGIDTSDEVTAAARLKGGWWPHPLSERRADRRCERFFAPLGCAVGGTSIFYAAALERMEAADFRALQTAGQIVPDWPVSFAEFARCYEAAERLYRVHRLTIDEARGRVSDWDLAFIDKMRRSGLRPELLSVAMRYDAECQECIGRICPRGCKADAVSACLERALREPACRLFEDCEVLALEADASRVRSIRVRHHGEQLEVRARTVVLAAGALHSPQILLRSRSAAWPRGLANSSDQVGRNLMFHTSDHFAVWAPQRLNRNARQKKSISVRDFYLDQGERLGYIQSVGLEVGAGTVAVILKNLLRRRGLHNELLLKLLTKVPAHAVAGLLGAAGVFAAMTEDDPMPDNRIVLDGGEPDGASFHYTISADLRRRADALYARFARCVRPWRLARLSPELGMNYGHPCGTCRFGNDPRSNVLDRNCRTHDIENLYVVDSSFMPRSGAVNPSLTIAANALRVAPHIAAHLAA